MDSDKMRLSGIVKHSFVDGPGCRCTIFFQGCLHNCPGCHNPDTHDMNGGELVNISDVIDMISSIKLIDGITLSGGDPIYQPDAVKAISAWAKDHDLNVWCYTGYTIDQIPYDVLQNIDVLVDGPFIESQKVSGEDNFLYRGSLNQRLIDVQSTLKSNSIVLYKEDV